MTLALDPVAKQRIQSEIDRGDFAKLEQVISRAPDLLESDEECLLLNKQAISEHLEESFAQSERGEVHTPDEVLATLESDRHARQAKRDASTTA